MGSQADVECSGRDEAPGRAGAFGRVQDAFNWNLLGNLLGNLLSLLGLFKAGSCTYDCNTKKYGMGCGVSTLGDVYSYGILLSELFTGRRPTEDMFKNGLSLHEFAKMAFPSRMMETADPMMLEENSRGDVTNNVENERQRLLECFASVVGVGIACSKETPRDRMQMKEVVARMLVVRDKFLGVGNYKER
ncbi:putative LRR receptor-like serine/threonine-protein kinase [Cinnamomum micranthum f. kanehirae]|uniref:Putative LRR receptor-like serine/threonine-protein kinase n=1 Tax=Cinnamomum micranthum f. kanehirae TaxID=337451 RepID=A0A3S3Q4U3_9MAGN|nr:putative LRR receptor-like serine/threonine-protein kinase [Cinnamomum micranthum f. kanehirae]